MTQDQPRDAIGRYGETLKNGLYEEFVETSENALPTAEEARERLRATLEPHGLDLIAADYADRLVAQVGEDVPEGYTVSLLVADWEEPGLVDRYGHLQESHADALTQAWRTGMPVDWPEQMAVRGGGWRQGCLARWNQGVTAEELDRLDAAGLAQTPTQARAFASLDAGEVGRWREEFGGRLDDEGIATRVRSGDTREFVRHCLDRGVDYGHARGTVTQPDGVTLHGEALVEALAEIQSATGRGTEQARAILVAGLEPAVAARYSNRIAVGEIQDFLDSRVDPKAVHALRGVEKDASVERISDLAAAGIDRAGVYRDWARALVTPAYRGAKPTPAENREAVTKALPFVREGMTPERVTTLAAGSTIDAVLPLHRAGVTDLAPWNDGAFHRTQHFATDPTAQYVALARFVEAGGSPGQFARTQRAGIPLEQAAAHVASTREELWQAGQPSRDSILAHHKRMRDLYGESVTEPTPWEVNGSQDL